MPKTEDKKRTEEIWATNALYESEIPFGEYTLVQQPHTPIAYLRKDLVVRKEEVAQLGQSLISKISFCLVNCDKEYPPQTIDVRKIIDEEVEKLLTGETDE